MLPERFIAELGIALQAQNRILREIKLSVAQIESSLKQSAQKLSTVDETSQQLRELELLMDELEADREWLVEEDFDNFNPDGILNLYQSRQQSVFRELTQIGFTDWDSFVGKCQTYLLHQGIDPLAPYDIFLTKTDLETLKAESYDAQYKWDKWDYIFVGASGVLASLTDFLLVRIPTTLNTEEYAGQIGSPITEWLKQYNPENSNDWFSQWVKYLSKICKVPYDSLHYDSVDGSKHHIAGMYPRSHRFQPFGHDPVLGFIFGILDIMRGTITGFSYEKLTHEHNWIQQKVFLSSHESVNLITAILRHIGHLISDVATPMGLPAPFMTLIQGMNMGSFGENKRTIGEIARWMYLNGYDLRHFFVAGITPAVIEIFLRAYIMLRHYSEHQEVKLDLTSDPKYRTMLLVAHGIATLGNAGKIVLMQGNPLAINYAEWIAFTLYLYPSLKYWLFDRHRLRMEHVARINSAGWDKLLQSSDRVFQTVAKFDALKITLGAIC